MGNYFSFQILTATPQLTVLKLLKIIESKYKQPFNESATLDSRISLQGNTRA